MALKGKLIQTSFCYSNINSNVLYIYMQRSQKRVTKDKQIYAKSYLMSTVVCQLLIIKWLPIVNCVVPLE